MITKVRKVVVRKVMVSEMEVRKVMVMVRKVEVRENFLPWSDHILHLHPVSGENISSGFRSFIVFYDL